MQPLHIEKTCNAFLSEADVSFMGLILTTSFLTTMIHKKIAGGLWVGGTFTANNEWILFSPGIANIMAHSQVRSIQIHFSQVRNIHCESGFFTDIVVIEHTQGEFKFRCYGAKEVANSLMSYLHWLQSSNNINSR